MRACLFCSSELSGNKLAVRPGYPLVLRAFDKVRIFRK